MSSFYCAGDDKSQPLSQISIHWDTSDDEEQPVVNNHSDLDYSFQQQTKISKSSLPKINSKSVSEPKNTFTEKPKLSGTKNDEKRFKDLIMKSHNAADFKQTSQSDGSVSDFDIVTIELFLKF